MTLFERTKELAKKRGFSLAEVERKAELSENYLYTWKRTDNPRKGSLEAVARVLGVTPEYLLNGNKEDSSKNEPTHINVDEIVENMGLLTSRKYALSDEDRAAISAMVKGYLETKEGQDRLRKYGNYNSDGSRKEE
ncbi:helix-turn-helix domain-containing protein [Lapidilactobacillus bayanensis]|uniref:helix-turn-helix domain-containing protein n=1 Tax=Lapidilactobacillus bayanensis TaxID=2485998 RepID=UPI000F7961AE|nr:helix-turn-helix transcriptional regulator [Lapidilactobacillus bayanensis]